MDRLLIVCLLRRYPEALADKSFDNTGCKYCVVRVMRLVDESCQYVS
jgi:hypothetical protein